jgi:hypothetical protein
MHTTINRRREINVAKNTPKDSNKDGSKNTDELFKELEASVKDLLEDQTSSLYITNLDQSLWSLKSCYCLILEKSKMELIERSPVQKNRIEFELESKEIFRNGKKQKPEFIGEFTRRVHHVLEDLQNEKASIYEND